MELFQAILDRVYIDVKYDLLFAYLRWLIELEYYFVQLLFLSKLAQFIWRVSCYG